MTQEDGILIQQAVDGQAEASRHLVDRYRGPLISFLCGLTSDESQVEDLAQDTFVRAFSSLSNFKIGGNFRSWLFGIAYHVHVDNLRKRREKPVQGLVEDEATNVMFRIRGDADSNDRERTEEKLGRLREALKQLNPEYQAVLSARYLEDMGRNEIAETLGISEYNVKMRLYRAKKELMDRYERLLRKSG